MKPQLSKAISAGKLVLAAIAAAAAIALGASSATAQINTPPAAAALTEAQIAASPAAKRLVEAIEAVGRGDEAIRSYLAANAVPLQPNAPPSPRPPLYHLQNWRYRSQGGLTFLDFMEVTPTRATARVRNDLTEEIDGVAIRVEAKAPHRIVWAAGLGPGAPPVQQEPAKPAPAGEGERLKEISSFIDRLADADVFSGVVLIARDGEPLFLQAYGYADREKRIPNTIDTRFRMASMSKMFTAFAIGRLVEQGKLSYEDPLSKFIPDFPDPESATKIKIKHLLSHTSGLARGYFNSAFWDNVEQMLDVKSVMAVVERKPLQFEPGTAWEYNNTNFLLLGRIIEVASGEDYFDYMEAMFESLGLENTGFPHYDRAGPEIALPWDALLNDDGELEHMIPPRHVRRGGPAGDGATTAPDLLRFSVLLQSGEVVKPETLRLHSTPKPELESPSYGYGTMIGSGSYGTMSSARVPGLDVFGHSGESGGTCTEFGVVRDTPSPYTVIILSNSSQGTCHPVGRKIYNTLAPLPASK